MTITKADFPGIKWVLNEWGEFPSSYSDNSCHIISTRYFNEKDEKSMMNLVARVVNTITAKGLETGHLRDVSHATSFAVRLGGILLYQKASFNSPVWFNVGVEAEPQCSACFIQSVEDTMDGILDLVKKEGMLFKYGSGTGTNFSTLRPANSPLSKGGVASGVPEFMKLLDSGAGVIKSGGKTRRAAKMAILNYDHGDIDEFIWLKAKEERIIRSLVENGMAHKEALARAQYQNANNTVRVSDEFMEKAGKTGTPEHELFYQMAQAAWESGDPGIQFDDTINRAMPAIGQRCNSSNPCGEYMFINESACNLASVNLMKVNPSIDRVEFARVVRTMILAMDIIVDLSSYPTEKIRENSVKYRPLGLGYTNLAAFLMTQGIAYGSAEAVEMTKKISSNMLFWAEYASKDLAEQFGGFPLQGGRKSDKRNAQLTLIAPTGTISFAMDAESTGIEPVLAESQVKELVEGGTIEIVPECVGNAPHKGAIKVALSDDPDKVVTPHEHLRMMEATQPYMSGAISKTINMPEEATVEDVMEVYYEAWKMGLKGLAIYRNNSKTYQPLRRKEELLTDDMKTDGAFAAGAMQTMYEINSRRTMPTTRKSLTHKFSVAGVEGYLTTGLYEDGTPGELFVSISKEGSTLGGIMDAWATAVSIALQYGAPLGKVVEKYRGVRFEPAGFTGNPDLPQASSVVDYIAGWLEQEFLAPKEGEPGDLHGPGEPVPDVRAGQSTSVHSGQTCPECGSLTAQTGSCHTCPSCGWGGGCG